jgi:hypothetical protein
MKERKNGIKFEEIQLDAELSIYLVHGRHMVARKVVCENSERFF